MKTFIGALASATARPSRSEESQAGGRPRPALEGVRKEASPITGSPVLLSLAQGLDEVGELDLAFAAQPFGGEDGA